MHEEIKNIFKNFKVDGRSIPVEHLRYKGKSKTFVTWTLLDEEPVFNGENKCLYSVCPVDIDIYSDGNYLNILEEIKKIMINSEWVWSGDSVEMYEDDTGLYHRTITFKKERFINNG